MDQPTTPQQPPKTTINLHQQKLVSLIGGAIGLLGLILPWTTVNMGGFGGNASSNGFGGWGLLSLLGVVGIIVSSLAGDKTREYDPNFKMVAMGSFGAIALGAFIVFMQLSNNNGFGGVKTGFGVWLCIIAGILGILWVAGIIKLTSTGTTNQPPANK